MLACWLVCDSTGLDLQRFAFVTPKKRGVGSCDQAMIRAICDAASEGKADEVQKLLRADPLLATARDEEGWTPCLRAAFFNQHTTAAILLRGGAPPNDTDYDTYGFSALHWAAERNNAHLIFSVAGRPGANMNITDRCGYTPLHRAALWNNLAAVVALVVSGADPRIETERGETAEALTEEVCIRVFLRASRRLLWSCILAGNPVHSTDKSDKSKGMRSPMSMSTITSQCGSSDEDDDEDDADGHDEDDEEFSSYQRLITTSQITAAASRNVTSMFVCREGQQQEQQQQGSRGVEMKKRPHHHKNRGHQPPRRELL